MPRTELALKNVRAIDSRSRHGVFRRPLETEDVLLRSHADKPSPGFHVGNAIDIVPMLRALALLFSFMQVFRVKDLLTLHLAQVQANQTLCTESWTGSPRS